jgi:AraC-like DNA-binding protein
MAGKNSVLESSIGSCQAAETGHLASQVCRQIEAILAEGGDAPTLANVAGRMSINLRTLQRRLADDNRTFRDLLAQSRCRYAVEALGVGRLSIAAIAARLGYSDPAHFARAFRAWTGDCPSSYQKRQ